jgi:hypothetical protein
MSHKGLKCKVFQKQSLNYHEKQKVNVTLCLKSKEQNCNMWRLTSLENSLPPLSPRVHQDFLLQQNKSL